MRFWRMLGRSAGLISTYPASCLHTMECSYYKNKENGYEQIENTH